jgi:hypothetical protein
LWDIGGDPKKEARTSFSEEKEAKRLSIAVADLSGKIRDSRIKVFWFFFSKKNCFLNHLPH